MMNLLAALIPYVAVLIGMYALHNAWLAILLYHLGIIGFMLYRKPSNLHDRHSLGDGGWKTIWGGLKTPLLIPGVMICAMAAPVIYFMWPFFQASEGILPMWLAKYGLTGWSWLLLIPYFSMVHPVLEEIHWRGMAPEQVTGFCWQDFLFAGYHVLVLHELVFWPWLFMIFGVLAASSFFWRWAAERFGGYGLPILTHAAADAGVVAGCWLLL